MKQFFTLVLVLMSALMYAQVEGIIRDEDGAAMEGVTILEKGTMVGTFSDESGHYLINCSKNATLMFSYIGYGVKEEVITEGVRHLDVSMQSATQNLTGQEIVGTRSYNRSAIETPVPIDFIPVSQFITKTGQFDVNQLLQFAAPSFNATRQSGADGSDHVDPATLRGLGPDQTLVLINGQRQHQSALVNLFGTRGRGNTGTDLNAIPASAIERIEILRDGAAAQYGSDAIAGVINIVLKSTTNELSANVSSGVTSEGDGLNFQANANYGFKLGKKGFLNVTLDYLSRAKTNRAADSTVWGAENIYRTEFGDASQNNLGMVINSRVALSSKADFYAFVAMNNRKTDAYAWTRYPDDARNVLSIYPNGFSPRIQSTINDGSFSAGLRGKVLGFDTDFNNTFGINRFHYGLAGSLNASLEGASPTSFDAGGFQQMQNTTGLKFSRYFDNVLKGFNLAFGSEYRIENYQLFAGEEKSWQTYGPVLFSADSTFDDNGTFVGIDSTYRPGGAQGFPGFRPANQVNKSRTNIGVYLDTELDIAKGLTAAGAVRFERYGDFGNTLNGKFALRYEPVKGFAVRGSVSTGFRAPSLAQLYFNTIYSDVVSGELTETLLAPNNSVITQTLGIAALKQEKSVNASFGITARPFTGFTITVDGYMVNIKDRVVLTGLFEANDSTSWGQDLNNLGVSGAQFFANAIDTKTFGMDIIVAYSHSFGEHLLRTVFAGNFNHMELSNIKAAERLTGYEDLYFGNRERLFLLASAPPMKLNLTLDYTFKRLTAMARMVYFGGVEIEDYDGAIAKWRPKVTTDFSVGYGLTKNISLTVGASNLFNVHPDAINPAITESGGAYEAVQMGYNGAFYFARLGFKF